jgi:hypothetical protein
MKAAGINNRIHIATTETGCLHQPKFTYVILSPAKPVEKLSCVQLSAQQNMTNCACVLLVEASLGYLHIFYVYSVLKKQTLLKNIRLYWWIAITHFSFWVVKILCYLLSVTSF